MTATVGPSEESPDRILIALSNLLPRKAADEFFSGRLHWKTLPARLETLASRLEGWNAEKGSIELSYCFNDDVYEARRTAFTAAIMVSAESLSRPMDFANAFESLFRSLLKEWQDSEDTNDDRQDRVVRALHTLGWMSPPPSSKSHTTGLVDKPLQSALRKTILHYIRESIHGQYESDDLYESIMEWRDSVVATWIRAIHRLDDALVSDEDSSWMTNLELMTAECFCQVRMEEIFDMVADYSDSHPAVTELRRVLEITEMHDRFAEELGSQLIKRLNHPGANTSQIIDVYIATIKVLRVIDPSDRLLEVVAEPVRTYLRGRADTVRCIITSMTDAELGGDLYQELRRQDAKPLEDVTNDSDDEEECPDFNWQPRPSIFQPKGTFLQGAGARSEGDILAMLVSIYGSKELFVNEYRLMLADKLLANLTYETDKDVHTLELLKLRFGESSMRNCEVMLKDIDDSKRTNTSIASNLDAQRTANVTAQGASIVDVATISHIFWPPLQQEPVKHHPRIKMELDKYADEFERLKNPRKLIWFDQLGSVELELDVLETDDEDNAVMVTKEFTCSPLLATLITHFEDKRRWSAEELSDESGIAEHLIEKRMSFWVNNRVVQIVPGSTHSTIYEMATISQMQEKEPISTSLTMGDEDLERHVSLSAQEEGEMEVYESYIFGMLTNMQQLPLDRIHNMLKMFVSGSDVRYNKTPQQLHQFLQRLVRAEKLECGPDGLYKLFKR